MWENNHPLFNKKIKILYFTDFSCLFQCFTKILKNVHLKKIVKQSTGIIEKVITIENNKKYTSKVRTQRLRIHLYKTSYL